MQLLDPLEIGVMFWAERDTLAEIRSLGVRCGQLGVAGNTELNGAFVQDWKALSIWFVWSAEVAPEIL